MPSQDPAEQMFDELTAKNAALQDQIDRLLKAREADASEHEKTGMVRDALRTERDAARDQLDAMRADLAREVSARMTANAERDRMAHQIADLGAQWIKIDQPFHALCERVIDSGRLVGFEVEIAGERYLIGDVNPGGHREGGQAFRRDAVVTRARVRVRK